MRYCPACGSRFSNDVRFCPHDGQPLEEMGEAQVQEDDLVGQVVDGRYRLDHVLGEGGMGVVYHATHTALNKGMALKVLRGDMARDETVVQRFVQEAQASSAIGHPNIIDITDFGRLPDGSAYFVMELLEGESLTDRIVRGALPPEEASDIAFQIASALGAAHARGIIHRDLKPDNVQLIARGGSDRFVKVLDFGIAKVGGANSKLTRTGTVFGTPHYMSPEQASGQSVDSRADVYALGVILFEMMTGRVPFDGDTFMGILSKHMFEPPPRPSDVVDQDFGGLEPIVMRALAKKPEDRYASMEDLTVDLETVRTGGAVAYPVSGAATPPNLGGMAAAELPSSRTPLLVLAAVVALLCAGGIAGAIAAIQDEPTERAANLAMSPGTPEPAAAVGEPEVPEPEPEPPAETQRPEPEMVEIATQPAGADVVVDGALVGNTPLRLERPAESKRVEIRMPGYETRVVSLSPISGERIFATLDEARRTRPHRMRPRMVAPTEVDPTPTPTMPMTTMSMSTRMSVRSEVVDPWAE